MQKLLSCILILSIVLLAGCTVQEKTSPPPEQSDDFTVPASASEETASILLKEKVIDAEGNVILDENGHINGLAAIDGIDAFTTEEILKIVPYSDGALATSVNLTLGRRLLKDFDGTLSQIAETEISEERGGVEQLGYGLGYEIGLDLQSGVVTEEDCKIIYLQHKLTAREQAVLDKIIEGFENAENN
ncbi:MAG: hypothetical protein GXY01_10290 [Clostridiales bacterium]|jgi:hypothetical protein|nr:hypothetical protein [Clostridiales bacterium]